MNKRYIWILLTITECLYIIIATALSVLYFEEPFYSELFKTLFRLPTLIVYIFVYRKYFIQTDKINNDLKHWALAISVILLFLFPFLFSKSGFTGQLRLLWFSTSFIIGFREEIFYRGIIQNSLNKTLRIIPTLLLTSLIFTFYHVYIFLQGSWIDLLEIFTWSIVAGLIYYKQRNIIFISIIHGVYDAIPFITPVRVSNVNYLSGFILLFLAVLMSAVYSYKRKTT